MKTEKPLSTISYNTSTFLERTLQTLLDDGSILNYAFIFHLGEGGDKDHFHVFIEPLKALDSVYLRHKFEQPCLYSDIPLGVMKFQKSNFDDWLMYSIHNQVYLNSKGEKKDELYSVDDVISTYDVSCLVSLVRGREEKILSSDFKRMYDLLASGSSARDLLESCDNLQQINLVTRLFDFDKKSSLVKSSEKNLVDCLQKENLLLRKELIKISEIPQEFRGFKKVVDKTVFD